MEKFRVDGKTAEKDDRSSSPPSNHSSMQGKLLKTKKISNFYLISLVNRKKWTKIERKKAKKINYLDFCKLS